tara:strand:- start:162 stop:491 length:330 start_codon:yes stop_codon:yes gene_type:complete
MKKTFKEFMEERTPAEGDKSFDKMRPGGSNSPLNKSGIPKGNPKDTAIMRMSGNKTKIRIGGILNRIKEKGKEILNRDIIAPTINQKQYMDAVKTKQTHKLGTPNPPSY